MRHFCVLLVALCAGAESATVVGSDITPRVGAIEVYGARKASIQKIRTALGTKPGDSLPSREASEERINKVAGILVSRVEAACCSGRDMILYVGVEERDAPHMEFHPAPAGDATLPADLFTNYRALLENVEESIRGRNADEDLTNGYSLMADPACRDLQQAFLPALQQNMPQVDKVLRESADVEQRAAAAYLLQYGPRGPHTSKTVVNGLQWALQDQEDAVRENALHSLRAVAVGAKLHPDQEISIEPVWLVELMNSVVWSDRFHTSEALVDLTESRNAGVLDLLRSRALLSVIEMARWHDLTHALPSFILAGRLAGLDENAIKQAWISENREPVLQLALNYKGKRAGIISAIRKGQVEK